MHIQFISIFLLLTWFSALETRSQVPSYNQYNGALAQLNPALIAHVNMDQVSLIGRNQWPGLRNGSVSSTFTFNKFIPGFNSSLGLICRYNYGTQGGYFARSGGLQYAYRVVVLEDYLLCAGIGFERVESETDISSFYPGFAPKKTFSTLPGIIVKSETYTLAWGVAAYNPETRRYVGFSVREQTLASLPGTSYDRLISRPSFSLHGTYHLAVTRQSSVYFFGELARNGEVRYQKGEIAGLLMPSRFYYFLQANLYMHKIAVLGMGYKYFSKSYGCFNFRVMPVAGWLPDLFIGYSFDTKPYIQYDKIRFVPSHEVWLSYRINSNR